MAHEPTPPDRFDDDPSAYAEYLRTPLGRLRTELAWAHLVPHLSRAGGSGSRALDLGGGTGEIALRLAAAGWHVTIVDRAPRMLERAAEAARMRGLPDRVDCRALDLEGGGLSTALAGAAFDLVVCHSVLEYVEAPGALLRAAAAALGAGGRISIVVRTRAGEVLKHAVRTGDIGLLARLLEASRVRDELYGHELRLFDADGLERLLGDAGLAPLARRGIRIVADYLPAGALEGEDAFARVLALERRLAERPELCPVARHLQIIGARRPAGGVGPGGGDA